MGYRLTDVKPLFGSIMIFYQLDPQEQITNTDILLLENALENVIR